MLVGRDLIRSAELATVITQHQAFSTAIVAFKEKYSALPGDMTNATTFWGTAAVCPGDSSQGAIDTTTCDGNGDGLLAPNGTSTEIFRFWQHLANAGLIAGRFSGVSGGGVNPYTTIASNSPTGKIGNTFWAVYAWPVYSADPWAFAGLYGNTLLLGGPLPSNQPLARIFRPGEMWSIDKKVDDGKPGSGNLVIFAYPGGIATCATSNNSTTAEYLLNSTDVACSAFFTNQF